MKRIILVLGGARSGKSGYAVELAKKLARPVAFIATASLFDEEMKQRIKKHQTSRPRHWRVIEEGKDISSIFPKLSGKHEIVIIDCLGLLISNLLADNLADKEIENKLKAAINAIQKSKFTTILVSNEVGMGIVPDNILARRFRDLLGLVNQMAARTADEVVLLQVGIPIFIKGGGKDGKIEAGVK